MQDFNGFEDAREKLIAVLGAELGTYSYKNSLGAIDTIPAIWTVHDLDVDPPSDHTASGLECLIFPALPRGHPLFSGFAMVEDDWLIRLIQHDHARKVRPAALAMVAAWPHLKASYLRKTTEMDEQANIVINQWSVI
jgi:hypothetical protein